MGEVGQITALDMDHCMDQNPKMDNPLRQNPLRLLPRIGSRLLPQSSDTITCYAMLRYADAMQYNLVYSNMYNMI